MNETHEDKAHIGAKLKALRKQKNLSLNSLAEELGMSYSYLWGLENDKHSISIVNLQRISKYFDVDLIYFFTNENISAKVKLIQKSDTIKYQTEDGMYFNVLSSGFSENMEISLIYHPAFSPSERRVYNHNQGEEEFITVLEGILFVQVSEINYKLEAGDSICFDARLDHTIYTEHEPARFFLISSPPYGTATFI